MEVLPFIIFAAIGLVVSIFRRKRGGDYGGGFFGGCGGCGGSGDSGGGGCGGGD